MFVGNFSTAAEMQTRGIDPMAIYDSLAKGDYSLEKIASMMKVAILTVNNKPPEDKEAAVKECLDSVGINETLTAAMNLVSYMIIGDSAKSMAARMIVQTAMRRLKDSTFLRLLKLPAVWGFLMLNFGISACTAISLLSILG